MMQNTNDKRFRFVEYSSDEAERTGYSNYSYWRSVFKNFLKKKSAVVMAVIFFVLVIFTFVAQIIGKYNYSTLLTDSSLGLARTILAVITGVRYGMPLRRPSSWRFL